MELVILSRVVASVRLCNCAIVRSFRLQSIHDYNKDARVWTWFDRLYLGIHQSTSLLIMGFAAWPLILANKYLFAIKFAHLWPIAKAVVSRPKTRNGCALACTQIDKRGISDTWTLGHLHTWGGMVRISDIVLCQVIFSLFLFLFIFTPRTYFPCKGSWSDITIICSWRLIKRLEQKRELNADSNLVLHVVLHWVDQKKLELHIWCERHITHHWICRKWHNSNFTADTINEKSQTKTKGKKTRRG